MHFIYTVIAFQALSPVIPEASYWIKFQGLNHLKKLAKYTYIYIALNNLPWTRKL